MSDEWMGQPRRVHVNHADIYRFFFTCAVCEVKWRADGYSSSCWNCGRKYSQVGYAE